MEAGILSEEKECEKRRTERGGQKGSSFGGKVKGKEKLGDEKSEGGMTILMKKQRPTLTTDKNKHKILKLLVVIERCRGNLNADKRQEHAKNY